MWPEVSVPLSVELEFTCRGQRSGGLPPPPFFATGCLRQPLCLCLRTLVFGLEVDVCLGGVVVGISVSDVDD